MNLEHASSATKAVVQLVHDMKSLAKDKGMEFKDTKEGFRIVSRGFNGTQDYSLRRLCSMSLISAVTNCPFKLGVEPTWGNAMVPEVDLSVYPGKFDNTAEMFRRTNKELNKFLSTVGNIEPDHIFWSRSFSPMQTHSAQDVFAVLGNVYSDGRFRNLSLTLNHFSYIYLTNNIKYEVRSTEERGQFVDLHEDSDKAYTDLVQEVVTRVKKELGQK